MSNAKPAWVEALDKAKEVLSTVDGTFDADVKIRLAHAWMTLSQHYKDDPPVNP